MPQWAGSCWYYLRFLDPLNSQQMLTPEAEKYWMPVDLYVGGAEHAVLHLLYARFWHKVNCRSNTMMPYFQTCRYRFRLRLCTCILWHATDDRQATVFCKARGTVWQAASVQLAPQVSAAFCSWALQSTLCCIRSVGAPGNRWVLNLPVKQVASLCTITI